MFTTCPKCALNLALTVADLRLGQGYVRCGRCANVFNALPALTDEGEADDSASATATRPAMDLAAMRAHDEGVASIQVLEADAPPGPLPEPEPDTQPETETKPEPEPESESTAAPEPEPGSVQAPTPLVIVPDDGAADPTETTGENEVLRTGTFETIVLEGDAITQTEETVAESEVDAQLQALVQRFDAVRETDVDTDAEINALWPGQGDGDPGSAAAPGDLDLSDAPSFDLDDTEDSNPETISRELAASLVDPARAPEPAAARPAESAPASDDPLLRGDAASPPPAQRAWAWLAGAVLLGVLLLGQVVHHFREDLASRSGIAGPLTAVYRLFHVTLEPRWDLAAYEVRQLGADAIPGAMPQIAVRASVRNRAPRAQPPPLLRVVLQDRFGKELATRDIAPADYLRGGVPAKLGADQRIDASLTLPDPGQNAVGFEIDACLRSARGVLRCASDPPAP